MGSTHRNRPAFWVLFGITALSSGCFTSPRPLPTSHPGINARPEHMELAIGLQMQTRAKLVSSEQVRETSAVLNRPYRIAILQLPVFAYRRGLSETCDWGANVSLSQLGANLRCGLRSDDWSTSLQVGAQWLMIKSFESHGEIQAGYRSDDFMLFLTAGLVFSSLTLSVDLEAKQGLELNDLVYDFPNEPWLEVFQHNLGAQFGLVWGVGDSDGFIYMGVACTQPFWSSTADFTCHGCQTAETFLSYDPGLRIEGLWGMSM